MQISVEQLELKAKQRVRRLFHEAKLQRFMPWREGVEVTDLFTLQVKRIPSLRNCFRIQLGPDVDFTLESGATKTDCEIRWITQIDTVTGEVTANPRIAGKPRMGTPEFTPELLERLGFHKQILGTVPSPLTKLFPDELQLICKPHFHLPDLWGSSQEMTKLHQRLATKLASS